MRSENHGWFGFVVERCFEESDTPGKSLNMNFSNLLGLLERMLGILEFCKLRVEEIHCAKDVEKRGIFRIPIYHPLSLNTLKSVA